MEGVSPNFPVQLPSGRIETWDVSKINPHLMHPLSGDQDSLLPLEFQFSWIFRGVPLDVILLNFCITELGLWGLGKIFKASLFAYVWMVSFAFLVFFWDFQYIPFALLSFLSIQVTIIKKKSSSPTRSFGVCVRLQECNQIIYCTKCQRNK